MSTVIIPQGTPGVEYRLVMMDDFSSLCHAAGTDGTCWTRMVRGKKPRIGPHWRQLNPKPNGDGYKEIKVCGRRTYFHQAVLTTFRGPAPAGTECRHLDGNPLNNRLDNLEWGTRKENCQDTVAHGRSLRGERSKQAKIDREQVLEIRQLYQAGMTMDEIAAVFKLTQQGVSNIVRGKTWPHIFEGISTNNMHRCVRRKTQRDA